MWNVPYLLLTLKRDKTLLVLFQIFQEILSLSFPHACYDFTHLSMRREKKRKQNINFLINWILNHL